MTSAASGSANTVALASVPYTTLVQFSTYLGVMNTADQANTRDDAGLPMVYGTCKLLDMLGYGSTISKDNVSKAAITKDYLGLDNLGDGNNPESYPEALILGLISTLVFVELV